MTKVLQCIIATIGRVPAGEDDLSDDERRKVGERCFGQHDLRGTQGGEPRGSNGPGDLDEQTLQCIISVVGRLPADEHDLTNEEKRAVGQRCFAGHDGGRDRSDGPGRLTAQEEQCIIRVLGRMPSDEHDLSNEEKRLLGQKCFAGQHGGDRGGPSDLDQKTIKCIVDTIGRMPAHRDDLTDDEERRIGQACFGGAHRGPSDLDEATIQCIENVLGFLPLIASGGIVDSKGYIASLALGAQSVQMGSRFVATHECVSHQNYKEAIIAAIDSGTVIVGGDRWPTRVVRNGMALRLKESGLGGPGDDLDAWEAELGMAQTRAAMFDGDLEAGIAYTGAGAGLISEVLSVDEVFQEILEGGHSLSRSLV